MILGRKDIIATVCSAEWLLVVLTKG